MFWITLRCNSPPPFRFLVFFFFLRVFLTDFCCPFLRLATARALSLRSSLTTCYISPPSSALYTTTFVPSCSCIQFFELLIASSIAPRAVFLLLLLSIVVFLLSSAKPAHTVKSLHRDRSTLRLDNHIKPKSSIKAKRQQQQTEQQSSKQQQWPASHLPRRPSLWPVELDVSTLYSSGVMAATHHSSLVLGLAGQPPESLHFPRVDRNMLPSRTRRIMMR